MTSRFEGRDDRNRLNPRREALGDDSVPCRWWHPDMVAACARCGSERPDLHDGQWWGPINGPYGPVPWTDVQRLQLGLPVEEQWWHQAAGLVSHE